MFWNASKLIAGDCLDNEVAKRIVMEQSSGAKVHIVTNNTVTDVAAALRHWGIPIDKRHIHVVKGDKSSKLRELKVDEFHDDSPKRVEEVRAAVRKDPRWDCKVVHHRTPPYSEYTPHVITKQSANLGILTYNVSWEAMSGSAQGSAREYGRKCRSAIHHSGHNVCFWNVVYVCSQTPYALVGLQESDVNLQNAIVSQLSQRHHRSYQLITKTYGQVSACIIYDDTTLEKVGKTHAGLVISTAGQPGRGRPIMGQLFRVRQTSALLAFINMHAPHTPYGLRANIQAVLRDLSTPGRDIAHVVVVGDFNKEHLHKFNTNEHSFQPAITRSRRVPTGWNRKNDGLHTYTRAVDNILVAGGKMAGAPETWHTPSAKRRLLPHNPSPVTNKPFPTHTSDHSPVAVTATFSP